MVRIAREWYVAKFRASQRGKQDRALTDVHDIEGFLFTGPKARKRLTALRQYLGFARSQKISLADPTREPTAEATRASLLNLPTGGQEQVS